MPPDYRQAGSAGRAEYQGHDSLFPLSRSVPERGTRVYSPHARYTEADPAYRPNSEVSSFDLPAFKIPRDELNIYSADPHAALSRRYLPGDKALFCIHPQVLDSGGDDPYLGRVHSSGGDQESIRVSPTSSTRSLYVLEPGRPHALKVHFPFRVSRYGRRMRDEVVEQAINVSSELQQGTGSLDPRFAFLREVLGVTYRDLDSGSKRGENWGYLVRDLEPFPAVPEERSLVPGFSLYGSDFFEPEKPLLLFELTRGGDPRTFVLEQVMFPIIRHWVDAFLRFGFLLEPHGQNVLLELGVDSEVARIVYRDLNLGIDCRRRRDLRLPVDPSNTYNQMESGEFNSITYDKFMGGHFFDCLVAALVDGDPGLDAEDFRGPCREEFARLGTGLLHRSLVGRGRSGVLEGSRAPRTDRSRAVVVRIALDTNAYSALIRGHRDVANLIRRAESVLVPAVTAGELL